MTSVVLDSLNATTDAFAGLYSSNTTYTTATLEFINVSQTSADFRVVDDSDNVYENSITVGGGSKGTIVAKNLTPGGSTMFYLERYEVDTWIRQTSTSSLDYVLVSNPTTSLSVATGSTSSQVTWATPVESSSYTLTYTSNGSTNSISTTSGESFLSGLVQGNTYDLSLSVTENSESVELATSSFITSSAAQMQLSGPFASYIGIDWTNSVDGEGSLYRIIHREGSSDNILAESSSVTTATIDGLSPGTEYNIVLQRKELDDSWSDQNEVIVNTLSSSMSFSSVASKTIELTWTGLYTGASFEVFYTLSGGSPVGNGQTTETSSILRNLSPGSEYTIDLVVYELGQTVGLSSLGLTTNKGIASNMNIILAVIAVIVILLGIKMMS